MNTIKPIGTIYRFELDLPDLTRRKIDGLERYESGWHYGEGKGFGESVIHDIHVLYDEALENGLYEADVFPGLDGEVMFSIYDSGHYLEFTVSESEIEYLKERDKKELCRGSLTLEEAKAAIREFRKELWSLSGLSVSTTMIVGSENSRSSHLSEAVPVVEVVSRLYGESAFPI